MGLNTNSQSCTIMRHDTQRLNHDRNSNNLQQDESLMTELIDRHIDVMHLLHNNVRQKRLEKSSKSFPGVFMQQQKKCCHPQRQNDTNKIDCPIRSEFMNLKERDAHGHGSQGEKTNETIKDHRRYRDC